MIYTSLDIISANTPNNISHFRTANPTIEIYQLLFSSTYGSITKCILWQPYPVTACQNRGLSIYYDDSIYAS